MGRPKKNKVQLSDIEVKRLNALRKKKGTSQTIVDRCNILLAVDETHLPAKTYDQCIKILTLISIWGKKGDGFCVPRYYPLYQIKRAEL